MDNFHFILILKHIYAATLIILKLNKKTDVNQTSTLFFFHNCRNHLTSWEVNHDTSCWNLSLQQWCLNSRRYRDCPSLLLALFSSTFFNWTAAMHSTLHFTYIPVWLFYAQGLFKVTNTGSIYWSRRRENKGQARQRYFNCSVRTASQ